MKNIERKVWIDYVKAISIFLVVLGHYPSPLALNGRIYAFHMPIFFFISGYLFSFDKLKTYKIFVTRRFNQIVVPYFFYGICTYFYWLIIARHFGADAHSHLPFYIPAIGLFYGTSANHYLDHDGPLWFLTCLFVVENLFYFFFSKINVKLFILIAFVFATVGYLDYQYDSIKWPWNLNIALIGIVFYAAGNIVKIYLNKSIFQKVYINILLFITLFFVFFFTSGYNLSVDFSHRYYDNYQYMYFNAFLGIGFLIALCKLIAIYIGNNKFVEFVSQNTLSIMALDFITMGVIKAIYHFVFKYPLNAFDNNIGVNFILAIIAFLLMLPPIYLLNKYLPFALGKSRFWVDPQKDKLTVTPSKNIS